MMDFPTMMEDFFATHDYSPYTVAHYRRWLEEVYQALPEVFSPPESPLWNTPTIKRRFQEWFHDLPYALTQKKQMFYALRAFLRWVYGERHPLLAIRMRFPEPPPPVREFDEQDALRLLHSFDRSKPIGIRDFALALLWMDTGLRVSEMARLTLSNLSLKARELRVLAKGRRWRRAVFSHDTAEALRQWLYIRSQYARPGVDAVFISLGAHRGKPLTREGLKVIVRKWGKALGIQLSPHDFRRFFATMTTRNGAPLLIVAEAGGWKNVKTVKRYTTALRPEDIDTYLPSRVLMRILNSGK